MERALQHPPQPPVFTITLWHHEWTEQKRIIQSQLSHLKMRCRTWSSQKVKTRLSYRSWWHSAWAVTEGWPHHHLTAYAPVNVMHQGGGGNPRASDRILYPGLGWGTHVDRCITFLFQCIWQSMRLPANWLLGIILPLWKHKDSKD